MSYSSVIRYSTEALFLGSNMKRYFLDSSHRKTLKVHSVFHKVINLESEIGLLSIVTSQIGNLINYAVIVPFQEMDFISMELKPQMNCKVDENGLIINEILCVNLLKAQEWIGVLDRGYKWHPKELKEDNILALKAALQIYGKKNSVLEKAYENRENPFEIKVLNFTSSKSAISIFVHDFIGLGPGLTPAGDDFLTGLLAVITSCSEEIKIKEFMTTSIYDNLSRTNYISRNMLINATQNIYHEYIQDLIYAVLNEIPEKVVIQCKRLLKIGATSGSDIATGIYFGFANAIGRQGENNCLRKLW